MKHLYRIKAAEALGLARQARQDGQEAAHAGYLSESMYWLALADSVARGTGEASEEVNYP